MGIPLARDGMSNRNGVMVEGNVCGHVKDGVKGSV